MYENNVKLHFVEYVERYVNVVWKKKFLIEKIRKIVKTKKDRDSRIRSLCNDLRKIKNDILNIGSEYKSKKFYHEWINEQKKFILPNKIFKKDSIFYDLKCSPLDYLPSMIFMMKRVESEECSVYNVFPMRTNIVPKYMKLDTSSLVELLVTKEQGKKSELGAKIKKYEDDIWKFFFKKFSRNVIILFII